MHLNNAIGYINTNKPNSQKLDMQSKEKGLTVGELVLTVGVLIIASLVWVSCSQKQESKTQNLNLTETYWEVYG